MASLRSPLLAHGLLAVRNWHDVGAHEAKEEANAIAREVLGQEVGHVGQRGHRQYGDDSLVNQVLHKQVLGADAFLRTPRRPMMPRAALESL